MVMTTYQYECNTTLLFVGFSRQEYWNTGILAVIFQARILEWVAFPFSSGSSNPGIEQGSPALQANSLPTELSGKPLKARILKWFAIPFSSGPCFVRTLHHDPSVLGGPTRQDS